MSYVLQGKSGSAEMLLTSFISECHVSPYVWDRNSFCLIQEMLSIKNLTDVHLLSESVLLLIIIA